MLIKFALPHPCVNYKLNHSSFNRSCAEWSMQKQIRRVTVKENMSYTETAQLKRFDLVNTNFTYANFSNPNYHISSSITLFIFPRCP